MWSGGVTHDGATVVAKILNVAAEISLQVQPVDGGAVTIAAGRADPGNPEVFRFTVSGLPSGAAYNYRVAHGSTTLPLAGRFRTFSPGPQDATVVFGSCATGGSNHPVWDAMRAVNPDVFVHMGDLHYENIILNDPARFHRAYDRCLRSPRQGAFYRHAPVAYVWDDHDFGGDESDRRSPSAGAAHQAYRTCVPHYPLQGGPSGTIQQAFDLGRVRIIVTDVRSARDPNDGAEPRSMLGLAQRDWLIAELERASRTAALVVWANGVPWITKADETTEHGWARYASERAYIASHIERLGLTARLVMISGDAHMVAIDDGTNSQYAPGSAPGSRGFVVVHAAPFDRWRRKKGGPYSHGAQATRGQFGELRIKDSGQALDVTLTGRDRNGRQIKQFSIHMTCVNGACTITPSTGTGAAGPSARLEVRPSNQGGRW